MIGRNLAVLAVLGAGVLCGAEKIELKNFDFKAKKRKKSRQEGWGMG